MHFFEMHCNKPLVLQFLLISLLPFKQKRVYLFWTSCTSVIQKLNQMFIFISLLPYRQVYHEEGLSPLYQLSTKLEKFLIMYLQRRIEEIYAPIKRRRILKEPYVLFLLIYSHIDLFGVTSNQALSMATNCTG